MTKRQKTIGEVVGAPGLVTKEMKVSREEKGKEDVDLTQPVTWPELCPQVV